MKSFYYIFFIALLFPASIKALSLLYSPEEEKEVLSYLQQQMKENQKSEEPLILSGFFYISPTRWCLWFNGKKCTPQECDPRYHIEHVTVKSVTLRIDDRTDFITLNPGNSIKTFQDTSGNPASNPVD